MDGSIPSSQVSALVELFHATGGANWTRQTNWLKGDPCDSQRPWYGVSCAHVTERTLPNLWNLTGDRGITALHLAANNLHGQIPSSLGTALGTTLQLLDLSSNLLEGDIPQTLLRGMPRLHTLYIEPKLDDDRWRLRGTLPDDMGAASGLPNLRYLGLSRNGLTGSLPTSFGQLPCRVTHASGKGHDDPSVRGEVACSIWIMKNNLTGPVPTSYCNRSYNEIYIGGNDISCPQGRPPCLSIAYGNWPSHCSAKCTPCTKELLSTLWI